MEFFVRPHSIVRRIWGNADTVLFIFAGSAAEFAVNKAVDWLYFTGRLPGDPIGRLFSTVDYARQIIFADAETAYKAIDRITAIHTAVEKGRGSVIPDWAYRDVLYMLIYYSVSSFELLERKLSSEEKEEVFDVFLRVGQRMHIANLPGSYQQWLQDREEHLNQDLSNGELSKNLYQQYKKHLGFIRYLVLLEVQVLLVPQQVHQLLGFGKVELLAPFVPLYKAGRKIKLDRMLKYFLLPNRYKQQIKALDIVPAI